MANLTTSSHQIQLGLCDPPEPIYLYVGQKEVNGETYLWYQYDVEGEELHPIKQRGLTGYISELRITVKEFKGKENTKLDVVVGADQLYIIRSGLETNFSKTLLLALSCVADFNQPLTVAVAAGEENVVFARLYDATTRQRLKAEWNPDADWLNLVSKLQLRLNQSSSVQELPKPVAPNANNLSQNAPCAESPYPDNSNRHQPTQHTRANIDEANSLLESPTPPLPAAPTLSHAERVKAIRTLTGHCTDDVRAKLAHYGTDHPKHLNPEQCSRLIESLVSDWYKTSNLSGQFEGADYRQRVEELRQSGFTEADATTAWMSFVRAQGAGEGGKGKGERGTPRINPGA